MITSGEKFWKIGKSSWKIWWPHRCDAVFTVFPGYCFFCKVQNCSNVQLEDASPDEEDDTNPDRSINFELDSDNEERTANKIMIQF